MSSISPKHFKFISRLVLRRCVEKSTEKMEKRQKKIQTRSDVSKSELKEKLSYNKKSMRNILQKHDLSPRIFLHKSCKEKKEEKVKRNNRIMEKSFA